MPQLRTDLFDFAHILEEDCEKNMILLTDEIGVDYGSSKIMKEANNRQLKKAVSDKLSRDESQYYVRQYIRSLFAFIEGFTHALKISALEAHKQEDTPFTQDEEKKALGEEKEHYLKAEENILFSFSFFCRAFELENPFDRKNETGDHSLNAKPIWWCDYKVAKKIRDRITHPKNFEEVNIKYRELVEAIRFHQGFIDEIQTLIIDCTFKHSKEWENVVAIATELTSMLEDEIETTK